MPPEQATGGEVTPRSDLYSLGAMLYELVTGRPPFVGDEAVAIIGQHLNTPPVAPTWHRPDCPPGLEALILRLLEKDPSKRPASAGEVREALVHIAANLSPGPFPSREGEDGGSPPLVGEGLGERPLDNPLYRRVFVGREHEVRQLQAAFDAALSGKGALAMVVGEPGIGKTAVCEQLATYVTLRGGTTLTGHCYEEGSLSLPYLAFVEALRSYAISRPPEALRAELGTAASDLARIVSEVRERLSVEPRPPGDPEEDRWRLLQAVSGFLRNASAVQPLLLVLEDLHWADQGTLGLLQHLARNLSGARLLVIGTYRDVEVDRSHPLSATLAELRRGAEFGRVLLRGLGTPEVQRMLLAIIGAEVPGSLAESIHRQTEGNPLFVQEVVRYLVEEGHLGHGPLLPSPSIGRGVGGEGQGGAAASLSGIAIPEGLRDVIGKRLSRLNPDCNRVLAVAAVIGRDFGLETLHAVVELDEEQVVSSLEEALHIGVLEEQSRPGSIRYRFAHAFFRQTLYEELIAPRRLRLHQQVAAALERQYANRLEEHAAELAEHFSQSTDRVELTKAVSYGELAAQRALAVYAYGEAARHLEQALAVQEVLDPDDTAKRCDLLLMLGEALLPAGDPLRVIEAVAPEALALAENLRDDSRSSRACQAAVEGFWLQYGARGGATAEFRRWAGDADRLASPGSLERVYADIALSRAAFWEDRELAWDLAERALALAHQLGDAQAIRSCAGQMLGGAWPFHHAGARLRLAEEFALQPAAGAGATAFSIRSGAFNVFLIWGQRERAEQMAREARAIADRTRHISALVQASALEIQLLALSGRLEEAMEAGEALVRRGQELGAPGLARGFASWATFWPSLHLGRAEGTLVAAEQEPVDLAGVLSGGGRGLARAHLGQWDAAREDLDRLREVWRKRGRAVGWSSATQPLWLAAAVLVSDRRLVELLRDSLAPAAGMLSQLFPTCIARHLGAASALLGETDKARGYYQQAIEICEKVRFRPELALTRLELAELMLGEANSNQPSAISTPPRAPERKRGGLTADKLKADASRAEALAHLDFAIAEFREMKMQPSLERALRHKDVLKA